MFFLQVDGQYLCEDGKLSPFVSHAMQISDASVAERAKEKLAESIDERRIVIFQRHAPATYRSNMRRFRHKRPDGIDIFPTDDEDF